MFGRSEATRGSEFSVLPETLVEITWYFELQSLYDEGVRADMHVGSSLN